MLFVAVAVSSRTRRHYSTYAAVTVTVVRVLVDLPCLLGLDRRSIGVVRSALQVRRVYEPAPNGFTPRQIMICLICLQRDDLVPHPPLRGCAGSAL